MDRLHLEYISEKDDCHYFEITNSDEFIKKSIITRIKAKDTSQCLEVGMEVIFVKS